MLNCEECPWYDEGDFTDEGEDVCRGMLEFGQCPYLYNYIRGEGLAD